MIEDVIKSLQLDEHATKLCIDLWYLAQGWDDIHDNDPCNNEEIVRLASIELPMNPYYQAYNIHSEVVKAHAKWKAANSYEATKTSLDKAYMLRAGYYDILVHVYLCFHGHQNLVPATKHIWDCYGETLNELINEVNNA